MIRRSGIDECELDGEEAVDAAFFDLFRAWSRAGHTPLSDEELAEWICRRAQRIVLEQRRRSRAIRRGGPGRVSRALNNGCTADANDTGDCPHGFQRVAVEFDQLAGREPSVEDAVDARLDFESLMERLADDRHRTVLAELQRGQPIEEIARGLDVSRRTLERMLKEIRSWLKLHPNG